MAKSMWTVAHAVRNEPVTMEQSCNSAPIWQTNKLSGAHEAIAHHIWATLVKSV